MNILHIIYYIQITIYILSYHIISFNNNNLFIMLYIYIDISIAFNYI